MVTVRSLSLFRRPHLPPTRGRWSLGLYARGVVDRRNWRRRELQSSAPVALDRASHAFAVRGDATVSNIARPWIDHVRHRVDVPGIARARRDAFDSLQIWLEKFIPEIVGTKADEIAGTSAGATINAARAIDPAVVIRTSLRMASPHFASTGMM